jgi:hypothetical protein
MAFQTDERIQFTTFNNISMEFLLHALVLTSHTKGQ